MKKPRAPRLVTVAITTTITVIFWIFFTLYQVLTTKPSPSVDPKLIEQIDPTLDTATLDSLKEKIFFEEGDFIPVKRIEATPFEEPENPTPVEEATSEASTP